eukprot:CAMPEP_0118664878 /NCGR_PEP_ID=MMETSP0785-20121206/18287_1 /TAXON_ID=91992 /ORGANISM="Bolidomonas pacifica, Strain CCMP 1866" /LENGTH=1828 /DNA_ID=CAMNT_0006558893 /DNA_START=93 /DNA_END=5579 /DNA_ORIENTATION=+
MLHPLGNFLPSFILFLLIVSPSSQSRQPHRRRLRAESSSHAADLFFKTLAKDHYSPSEVTEIENHDNLHTGVPDPRSLIVEGEDSIRGRFRWMTALISPSGSGYYQFCGASLIHERYVLTAAHCVEGTDLTGGGMTVAIGRYQLHNVTEHGELMSVKAVYQHPDYNEYTMRADIAVLELPEKVTHPYIETVPLITAEVNEFLQHGSIVTASGWGALYSSDNPSRRSLLTCSAPVQSYVGDGYCDKGDEINNEGCGWDGGDCCKSTCTCTQAATPGCFSACGANGFDCKDPAHGGAVPTCQVDSAVIGDGYCDSGEANSELCGWDGGDCCESSCSDSAINECGVNGYTCLDPTRTDNNVQFCAPGCPTAWSLDTVCNDACNVASCNFDGGACSGGGENPNHIFIEVGAPGSSTLKEVSMPLVSYEKCNAAYASSGGVTDDTVCAGLPEGGPDSCQGDSGGPLVFMYNNKFYQVGVVSWGIGCGWEGYYGVYASVNYYRPWVENFLVDFPFEVVEFNDNENSLPNLFGKQLLTPLGGEDVYPVTIENTIATTGLALSLNLLATHSDWKLDKTSCDLPNVGDKCVVSVTFKPSTASTRKVNSLAITTTFESASLSKTLQFKAKVVAPFDEESTIHSGLNFYSTGGPSWEFIADSDFDDLSLEPLNSVTIQPPTISHGQASCITTQIDGPDLLTFTWAAHCELGYDFMKLFVGFEQIDLVTGITPWVEESHTIAAGTHRISFCYIKDAGNSVGLDEAYVGNFGLASLDGCTTFADLLGLVPECSCNGKILDGTTVCECLSDWEGPECGSLICADGCINGACTMVNGRPKCICSTGFSGSDCSEEEYSCTTSVMVEVTTKKFSSDNGWAISKLETGGGWAVVEREAVGSFDNDGLYKKQICLNPGVHKLTLMDVENNGWHGGTVTVKSGSEDVVLVETKEIGANAKAEIFEIAKNITSSCSDGLQNGAESDVDCGSDCDKCGFRKKCYDSGDCLLGGCGKDIESDGLMICGEVGISPLKPESYEVVLGGSTMDIEFSVAAAIADDWKVDIDMEKFDGSGLLIEAARNVGWSLSSRTGSVSVTLGKFLPTGLYRCKMSWKETVGAFVYSEPFQLTGSSIEISEPSGEERLIAGMTLDVKVLTGGFVGFVSLFFEKEGEDGGNALTEAGDWETRVGSMNEMKIPIPKSLSMGRWRIIAMPVEDKATGGAYLIGTSAWFWLNEEQDIVLVKPLAEAVFVGGEEMSLEWLGSIPTSGGLGLNLKSRECGEEIWYESLNYKDSAKGKLDVTLPHLNAPTWVTLEVAGEGVKDAVDLLLRPESVCRAGCYEALKGDGVCHRQCNTFVCGFDDGDCCLEGGGDSLIEAGDDVEEGPRCLEVNVGVWIGAYGSEVSWEIPGTCPPLHGGNGEYGRVGWYNVSACIPYGVHSLRGYDSVGDGWGESFVVIEAKEGVAVPGANRIVVEEAGGEFLFDVCEGNACGSEQGCDDGIRLTKGGNLCVFPFLMDGVLRQDCVPDDSGIIGLEVCATEIDPCSCTHDGMSGGIQTSREGCVKGGKESMDLACKAEHSGVGKDSWCYVVDPVMCARMTAEEREIKGLVGVTYFESVGHGGAGWRYCDVEDENHMDNWIGELGSCELCKPIDEAVDMMIYIYVGVMVGLLATCTLVCVGRLWFAEKIQKKRVEKKLKKASIALQETKQENEALKRESQAIKRNSLLLANSLHENKSGQGDSRERRDSRGMGARFGVMKTFRTSRGSSNNVVHDNRSGGETAEQKKNREQMIQLAKAEAENKRLEQKVLDLEAAHGADEIKKLREKVKELEMIKEMKSSGGRTSSYQKMSL